MFITIMFNSPSPAATTDQVQGPKVLGALVHDLDLLSQGQVEEEVDGSSEKTI